MVPLVLAAGFALPNAQISITDSVTGRLKTVADLKTVQVRRWLNQGREVAQLVSILRDTRNSLRTLLDSGDAEEGNLARRDLYAELRGIAAIFPSVWSISLLHATGGQVLLSTDPALEGRDRGDEGYFRAGQQGLHASPVLYSLGRETPVLVVSAPLRDNDSSLLAVVAVEMNLSDLATALSSRAGLGETGTAYLVDAYGFYVTSPSNIESDPLRAVAESEGVRRALSGQDGSTAYLDPRGISVIGIYRWLPKGNLGLLVEIEKAELTSQIRQTWALIVITGLALLLFALLVAHYMAKRLASPLMRIAEVARTLRAGDMSRRVPIGGSDEIGQLAAAFNKMADGLQHSYEDLEHLVEQRTAKLSEVNASLTDEIAERIRVEEKINQLNEELEQRVEDRTAELRAAQDTLLRNERLSTLGQLTATVSHELRNPLGVIRTSSFILHNALANREPRVARALERIERAVVRCDRIIDELLDFTRISGLEPEPMPIDRWLASVLGEQVPPSGVRIEQIFTLPGVSISFDPDRLRRAVINIFDNACQAMLDHGTDDDRPGEHLLTVRTQKRRGRIEVHFQDSGPGMPPDVRAKIFEPLFSTKGFGVGLGLPVVKQIMEQHGGGIEIETEEGRGTRVCLWLPFGYAVH